MKPEVRELYPSFTARFEGRIPWFYLDVKGLVTVGLGCLIVTEAQAIACSGDPRAAADFRLLASRGAEQRTRHSRGEAWSAGAQKSWTKTRLTEKHIDDLARLRLDANERILRGHFPEWDEWPAEAQLGVLSMAWALGAGFPRTWVHFRDACLARDWAAAAEECRMREQGNAGIVPRNAKNKELFLAACERAHEQPRGITDDDRANVDRLQALWFDLELHPIEGDPNS